MNILILNPFIYTPEKSINIKVKTIKDTMMYNMCLGFKELGHQVSLAVGEEFRPVQQEIYDFNVMFFKSNYQKFFPPTILPYSIELKQFLKTHHHEYDWVITSEVFMFPSLFAALICPEKTVIWHELALHQRKFHSLPSKFWYNIIAKHLMNKVKVVIPRSPDAQRFIRQYMVNVSDKCVEHGINIQKFTPSRKKEDYVVYIGQFIERKNIPSILIKFTQYLKMGFSLKLKLIGSGPMEEKLKDKCTELGITDFVEFMGFMNHQQLNQVLSHAKGMLIDTKQDNNMVSIPEAIVSGTPVLTNKIPTNAYTIEQHQLGIAKEQWDAKDLRELIDNNSVYVDHCIKFREILSNKHQADSLIKIIESFPPHKSEIRI